MNTETDVVRLGLEVWHPECWALEATADARAGIVGGMRKASSGGATCRDTVYGDTVAEVEELIDLIRNSEDIRSIHELNQSPRSGEYDGFLGNTSRDVLIEIEPSATQIAWAFFSRGFVCTEPIRVLDGKEYWTLLTTLDWDRVDGVLDEIRAQRDAEIHIQHRKRAADGDDLGPFPLDRLSSRQREVFELARERGYYAWPKNVTPAALADELGVTSSTFHEHLHKAEEKLFDTS